MLSQVEEEKRQERLYILEKARLLKVSSSQFTCLTSTKVQIRTAQNDKARLLKVSKFTHEYMCPHYYQEEKAAAL
jgi:hypothetical protein